MSATRPLELEGFYPATLAALTAPVRFLEWKLLKVASKGTPVQGTGGDPRDYPTGRDWNPLAVEKAGSAGNKRDAAKSIEGPRWVYAFARPEESADPPFLVEELYLAPKPRKNDVFADPKDPTHTIFATPLGAGRYDGRAPKIAPAGVRAKGEEVGDTIRFVRVYRGKPMVHYFFATRVQLSPEKIEALRKKVHLWTPPTYFSPADQKNKAKEDTIGENDPNVVGTDGHALLVPVLDPLSIAMGLHAAFSAVADDLIEYVGYEDQEAGARDAALARQQKLLLARLVQMVLQHEPSRKSSLKTDSAVDDWIAEHDREIERRMRMRDTFATYLWNWLQADPLHFVESAHFENPDRDGMRYFVPFAMCMTRGIETAPGRAGLDVVVTNSDGRWDWIHDVALPTSQIAKTSFKVSRKGTFAVLEMAAPLLAQVAVKEGTAAVFNRLEILRTVHRLGPFKLDGKDLPTDPVAAAKAFAESEKKEIEMPGLPEAQRLWKSRFSGLKGALQAVNLTLYIVDALGNPSWDKITQASGGALSTTKAMLDLMSAEKGTLFAKILAKKAWLGYASGVIDVIVGVKGILKAASDGDTAGEIGNVMVTAGGILSTFGPLMFVAEAAGPVAIVGLLLAAVGYIVIAAFKKDPMTKFLEHSAWGPNEGSGKFFADVSGMEDVVVQRGDWLGQTRALLGVLCHFELAIRETPVHDEPDFDHAWLKMSWLPPGSKIKLHYEEAWSDTGMTEIDGTWYDPSKKKGAAGFGRIKLSPQTDKDFFLEAPRLTGRSYRQETFRGSRFSAQLVFEMDGRAFTVPPSKPAELVLDADEQRANKQAQINLETHSPTDE